MFTSRILGKRRPNGCPVAPGHAAVNRLGQRSGIAVLEGEDNDPVEWEHGAYCFHRARLPVIITIIQDFLRSAKISSPIFTKYGTQNR